MADIPITGVPATDRDPNVYVELLVAQGEGTAAVGEREVVFAMPMLSTGSWTSATLHEVQNEQDAIDGAGAGSPLHRAVRKFLKCNNQTRLWALPVAETSGGSPVAGTFGVTWTTDPTAAGDTTVQVGDEVCTYSFDDGTTDTVTTIAAAIAALINAKTHLAASASSAAGVLTVTAKLKGISQGNGTLDVIPVRTKIDPGCGTTVSASGAVGDTVAGAEGSTTEAANLATALATIDARRIYYVVSSSNDSTSWTNLVAHISNKSDPKPGLRSHGIVAYTGAQAGLTTLTNGQNYERLSAVWQEDSDHDNAELAANLAAVLAKYENTDATHSFTNFSRPEWQINKQYDDADWPTSDNISDAINDGICPVRSNASGSILVKVTSTRSKDSGGTVDDFRATERHRVSGPDHVLDQMQVVIAKNSDGKKLVDDKFLDDGTVDPNAPVLGKKICRPSDCKRWIIGVLQDNDAERETVTNPPTYSNLQNVQSTIDGLRVVKSTLNTARICVGVDLHTVDHYDQTTIRAAEVSPG